MQHLDYTALFRTAAEKHVELKHSATEMHFARVTLTGWPVTKLDIEEFNNALKNEIRLPILLLESYDARYQENSADNIRKLASAAFIILAQPATAGYDDRDQAIQTAERIGEEVLGYAIEQYRKKSLKLDVSTISTQKVGPISNQFWGVRFDFQLPAVANNPLAYQAAKFS